MSNYRNQMAVEEELGYMPSRYLCDILSDMRDMYKTRNFSGLEGSIEQAQVMASRMEAALGDKQTIEGYDEESAKLGRELKSKRKEISGLNKEIAKLNQDKKELVGKVKRFRDIYNKETKGGTLDKPSVTTGKSPEAEWEREKERCRRQGLPEPKGFEWPL